MDKRKLAAALALGGSIAIATLFGGGDEPVSGSYRGGYYAASGSYQGGMVDAGWDTVILMFVADTTVVDHYLNQYDADLLEATEVIEYGSEATEFAWGYMDAAASNQSFDAYSNYEYRTLAYSGAGTGTLPVWTTPGANQGFRLMYLDWLEHIPAEVTIIDAYIGEIGDTQFLASGRDSVVSVLMTNAGDSEWYGSTGLTGVTYPMSYLSHATYDYQLSGLNAKGYPATNVVWNPLPSAREYFDWGDVSDWGGFVTEPSAAAAGDNFVRTPITNCVQATLLGATNNGIITQYNEIGGTANRRITWHWEEQNAGLIINPWVYVKYITKRYVAPFPGGKEFAFVFFTSTSDSAGNAAYTEACVANDGSFTITIDRGNIVDAHLDTWERIFGYYEKGMEIGSHGTYGNFHTSSFGAGNVPAYSMVMTNVNWEKGMQAYEMPESTPWDTLCAEMDPQFIHQGAGSVGYPDSLKNSDRVGRSFTSPSGNYSGYQLQAAQEIGLDCVSGNYTAAATDIGGILYWFNVPYVLPVGGVADSLNSALDIINPRRPQNKTGFKMTTNTYSLVGDHPDDPTEAEVKGRIRSLIREAKAQNTLLVSMYSHGLKNKATNNLMDADEFTWILEVVVEENGWIANMGEYARWMKQWGTAVATPAGYGQTADFRFTAEEETWFVPDGMGDRFIPGVKQ